MSKSNRRRVWDAKAPPEKLGGSMGATALSDRVGPVESSVDEPTRPPQPPAPTAPAAKASAEMVTVSVPKGFKLQTLPGVHMELQPGIQRLPRAVAEHPYAKACGVRAHSDKPTG